MGNLPKLPMHRPDDTVWCLYGQTDTDGVYAVISDPQITPITQIAVAAQQCRN